MAKLDPMQSSRISKPVRVVASKKTTQINPPRERAAEAPKLARAIGKIDPLDYDRRMVAHVIMRQLWMIGHPDSADADSAQRYIDDFQARFGPRDVMEEMLFGQLLATHVRVLQLCHLASQSMDMIDATQFNIQADRVVSCFQSHLTQLMEYRERQKGAEMTNELKIDHEKATLPLDPKRLTVTQSIHSPQPALEEVNRPQIIAGQEDKLT